MHTGKGSLEPLNWLNAVAASLTSATLPTNQHEDYWENVHKQSLQDLSIGQFFAYKRWWEMGSWLKIITGFVTECVYPKYERPGTNVMCSRESWRCYLKIFCLRYEEHKTRVCTKLGQTASNWKKYFMTFRENFQQELTTSRISILFKKRCYTSSWKSLCESGDQLRMELFF